MNSRKVLIVLTVLMAIVLQVAGKAGEAQAATAQPEYFSGIPNWSNSPPLTKFKDTLPGLCPLGKNNLQQCIPLAVPDQNAYPGSDYYEIGLTDYTEQMHSDLPKATRLRGYYQKNAASGSDPNKNHYLGPLILATKNRPVRVKFFNELPTGLSGNLFIPVDTTTMGAGMGPDGTPYTQNRATLHLHGGNTPWISDGTPHQWTVPAGETTNHKKGVSTRDVPDMPAAGDGEMTFYWPNQQSGRLMFYHDHAYGITRLNVYAGEAAGYLLVDPAQEDLLAAATVPGTIGTSPDLAHLVPLVIQDKSFVNGDATRGTLATDPTWAAIMPGTSPGDLWFPHVYMPNQWPDAPDLSGANPMGRWDYGPWFWPVFSMINNLPVVGDGTNGCPVGMACPNIPNPSMVPEAFMDTPIVNGTAYPTVTVEPTAYRFQVLNACNDRFLNLQLYVADATGTEVTMVPATGGATWPATWPTDNRVGGVPDPATAGPAMVQIGTEGGLLPKPVVIPPQPVGYNYNRRDIVVLNIADHALYMGPAERADIVIDFSAYAGKTLILYNDAPAPVPAFDPRIDYYTNDPDQTSSGGAPTTLPGVGPNTRTIMQIKVAASASAPSAFNPGALQVALPAIFAQTQDPIIVPQTAYPAQNGGDTMADNYSRISSTTLSFTNLSSGVTVTMPLQPKAIQELFEMDYGRMNATLGVELPFTNSNNQTTVPLGYIDPATEILKDQETQIWKLTHNGVDTHAIHFHLFTVQVINRVGWDGAIRPPDDNELSWKDTVKMNPLEDIIVALKPVKQTLPFPLPDSERPYDVTRPVGATFASFDPLTGQPITATNTTVNFGQEYVWHCHLLGHEENDMMRPLIFQVPPDAPSNLVAVNSGADVVLSWKDNSASETSFTVQRDTSPTFATAVTYSIVSSTTPTYNVTITNTDIGMSGTTSYYRVQASSPNGTSAWSNPATNMNGPYGFVMPASLLFGSQLVNTPSTTQAVTFMNIGTVSMTGIVTAVTGTNAGEFAPSSSCGGTLAPGAACTIGVTFTPAATGPRSASLSVSSDALNTPSIVALGGTGIAPLATVLTTALTFTNQAVNTISTAQTVTLSNAGAAPLMGISIAMSGGNATEFVQTNTCGTILSPGVTCSISVTFSPLAPAGAKSATMNITSSDTTNPTIPVMLTGTGVAVAATSVVPASLTFGNQLLTTISAPQTITVTNTGSASVTILSTGFTGTNVSEFLQSAPTGSCPSIAPGFSCSIGVSFAPTTPIGAKQAAFVITTDLPVNPVFTIPLSGTGVAPVAGVTPASLVYGAQLVNTTSAPQTVTLSNTGNLALAGITTAITGANAGDFAISATTCNAFVATGANCTISVTFRPLSGASRTATLTIGSNDPVTPTFTVSLSGTATGPIAGVSPTSVSFGSVLVSTTSATQTVTLSNTGTAPLAISSISVPAGDFLVSSQTCTTSLAAGGTCSININFTPTIRGTQASPLTITSSDTLTPTLTVPLNGTGIQPVAGVAPATLTFATQVLATNSAPLTATLSNTGNMALTIGSIARLRKSRPYTRRHRLPECPLPPAPCLKGCRG